MEKKSKDNSKEMFDVEKLMSEKNISRWLKRILFIILAVGYVYCIYRFYLNAVKTEYWHKFAYRVLFVTIAYAFGVLHCFLKIDVLYDWIFRWRFAIAIAAFVFLVANNINYSSMACYTSDGWVEPSQTTEFGTPVFFESRTIRSDEWLVNIGKELAAGCDNCSKVTNIVFATETDGLTATGLKKCYGSLSTPHYWGFYLFGSSYGLSWMWNFIMIVGFMASFELCLILTRGQRLLSLIGAVLIWFSSYNIWWSTVQWLWTGEAAIVCFYYMLHAKKELQRMALGVGLGIFFADFVVSLYPAWQVPAGYVFLAIVLWIIIEARNSLKGYTWKAYLSLGIVFAFSGSILIDFLYEDLDYITRISRTIYPGARVEYGGNTLSCIMSYMTDITSIFRNETLANGSNTFVSLFPFPLILLIYVLWKKRGKDLLLVLMSFPLAFLMIYCTCGLPPVVAKVTLMTNSTASRAHNIIGYICVLILIVSIARIREEGLKFNPLVGGGLVTASIALSCYYSYQNGTLTDVDVTMFVFVGCFVIWMALELSGSKRLIRQQTCAVAVIYLLALGLSVHPVMIGISAIYEKDFAVAIREIVEEDSDGKWLALGSLVNGDFQIACGAPTYNCTNTVPNLQFWDIVNSNGEISEEVYNRYAHLVIYLTDDKSSSASTTQEDCIELYLAVDKLADLDVSYVSSTYELTDTSMFEELYAGEDIYIYRVLN